MRAFSLTLAVLMFVTFAYAASDHITLIVGGEDAPIGKYPYQVSLRYHNMHICAGSIIDTYNILTAAHCVNFAKRIVRNITVHVGTNFLDQMGEVYLLESVNLHEDYNSVTIVNDIALIHLKTPILYNEKVQPIELANIDVDEGSCTSSGWGFTKHNGVVSNNLKEVDLMIYPYRKCKTAFSNIERTHICTLTKVGEGTCQGDSGGPLVANGVQIGIVSFGRQCAFGYPDVYTRVYYFKHWIAQHKKFDDMRNHMNVTQTGFRSIR